MRDLSRYYYKCCLWALKSELLKTIFDSFEEKNIKAIIDKHHIICHYLKKYEFHTTISAIVDESFNLIRLSYPMHYFMHAVHAFEYDYFEDYHFLDIVDKQLVKTQNSEKVFEKGVSKQAVKVSIMRIIKEVPDSVEKLSKLKEWQAAKSFQGGKTSGVKRAMTVLDPNIKDYLKNDMRWTNKALKVDITFKPKDFNILRELVIKLHQFIPNKDLKLNWQNDQHYLDGECTRLKQYLLGTGKSSKRAGVEKFYSYQSYKKNWYCDQAETNQNRLNTLRMVVESQRQTTNSEDNIVNLNLPSKEFSNASSVDKQGELAREVLNSTCIWSNQWSSLHKDPSLAKQTKKLITKPKQFNSFKELVKYLMDLLPPAKLKKYPKYRKFMYDPEARKDILRGFNSYLKSRNACAYGWTFHKSE